MPKLRLDIDIMRPVEDVFAFTDNPSHERVWRATTVEAEVTSDGPIGVGTRGRDLVHILGRDITGTWTITEYEPTKRVAYVSDPQDDNDAAHGAYIYEAIEGGTRFSVEIDVSTYEGFIGRLSGTLIGRMHRRAWQGDLQRLKQLLEA